MGRNKQSRKKRQRKEKLLAKEVTKQDSYDPNYYINKAKEYRQAQEADREVPCF